MVPWKNMPWKDMVPAGKLCRSGERDTYLVIDAVERRRRSDRVSVSVAAPWLEC